MEKDKKIFRYIHRTLSKRGIPGVKICLEDGVISLTGDVPTLEDRMAAGYRAAKAEVKFGLRGVVNDITVGGRDLLPWSCPIWRMISWEGDISM